MKNGAVNFVLHKIKAKNHPVTIAESMARMGYNHDEISEIFIEVGRTTDRLHQELLAGNEFLPTLNENLEDYFKEGNIKIFQKIIIEVVPSSSEVYRIPKTLFPYPGAAPVVVDLMKRSKSMAMTRHVFVFKLLYALSMAVLGIVLAYVFIKTVGLEVTNWNGIISANIMLAITALTIFTLYIFQLFAHRLQNAGMNHWLSLLLITPFLSLFTMSESDHNLVLILSCIPILSVFIIAVLLPTHRYRL